MAQITTLAPTATPGQIYSFSAKSQEVIIPLSFVALHAENITFPLRAEHITYTFSARRVNLEFEAEKFD